LMMKGVSGYLMVKTVTLSWQVRHEKTNT
jgi:hypothetical protein